MTNTRLVTESIPVFYLWRVKSSTCVGAHTRPLVHCAFIIQIRISFSCTIISSPGSSMHTCMDTCTWASSVILADAVQYLKHLRLKNGELHTYLKTYLSSCYQVCYV